MQALVLERKRQLSLRDIDLPLNIGPQDVKIRINTVGICGSDVHYYTHGHIGPYVVDKPMILGHEASGVIVEVGSAVKDLKPGDRVCMEPGIPNPHSKASKLGLYNIDPEVIFWATPPVHGCLTPLVIHPAAFTYKIPENVSFGESAMVEPLAIGLQAATKAKIVPGDVALVIGAGTIGIMVALAALAGGCSQVFIADLQQQKLEIASRYVGITPINITQQDLVATISDATAGWGVDIVCEASGSAKAYSNLFDAVRPGGAVVFVGCPIEPVTFDIVKAQSKEVRMETVFRYANIFDRALNLIASGKVDLKPLISETFPFNRSIEAFDRAAEARATDIKLQIRIDGEFV
ncbi:NAD(P)-dependent alcohol dehydrogenase [Beijerinckia indica]|uniref:Alcohol dehydrogenase GroES domain protein n=1 Tax=Beijerinckia indica subsp. indica (strain ATCC 9039 / DSM 1715 / NCIMB 8712) TaxID=395963 RepID=B2ILF1_BEII9|nr:NAD(P)-dependent alcohol dehydrogenase [Beijerinckia indica]ACB97351.1 Alcohol dehydrogenase GroES domain protein [Beijerinckia indica subsp. indica ATCC 9039]